MEKDNLPFRPVDTIAKADDGLLYESIRACVARCHGDAKRSGWWHDIHTGEPLKRNVGEMLMLVVSELAEAMEGHRKNLRDDKLTHRDMLTVELADAIIRIFDLAGGLGLDLSGAFVEKLNYNCIREDHRLEHRRGPDGKKY